VLTLLGGAARFALMGGIVGLDMPSIIAAAQALNYDCGCVIELIGSAQGVIVAAMNGKEM
jgi:hypothetical protein